MRATVTGQTTDPVRILLVGTEPWLARTRATLTDADDRIECAVATTVDDAAEEVVVEAPPVHAVVAASELDEGDGLALLGRFAEVAPAVPVILHPERGSEQLASDAIGRGAADYLPASGRDRLGERVLAAIDEVGAERERRRMAARFETTFDAPDRFVWVLDAEGTITAANAAARGLVEDATDAFLGKPFAASPWCGEDAAPAVERAVGEAADGADVWIGVDGLLPGDGRRDERRIVQVAARPVRDASGRVREVVLEADDASRRRRREMALRRSERLHRITLNNMTDTVLVTDDDGAFVYVCPNVHFIFGHTVEEVHELGTIDELLGGSLFEPGRLEDEGVLTNVECTTTDAAGEERTLLVNVKQVSIQGGTRLYSCRDVTKRKERERALTTLHDTARELLYAETDREIGRTLVADATEALGADGAALYRFDGGDAVLRPIATTDRFERLHGPLPELAPDANSIVGRAFVEGEPTTFADVHDSDRLTNPATGVRGCTYVPIGEHGVLVVGSERADAFDPIATEVARLVAATAEAAFDRVDRMAELRRRDRELQRRNERLAKINRINDLIREIDRSIVRAETREEIERAVCEQLTSAGRFGFAWIADDGEPLEPRATGGASRDYLDAIRDDLVDGREPAAATARTREPGVVGNVADALTEEPWRREALARGFQSVVAVPLAYEGVTYGTLAVYANEPDAFDEVTRDVLVELGETVASAIGSLKRKDALVEGASTELEYETADRSCLPYAIARRAGCSIALEGGIQQVEEGVLAFVTIEGAAVERVESVAGEFAAVEEATAVDETPDGGTVRLRLSSPFVATTLADHGIVLRHLAADPESARIVVDVPASVGTRTADEVVGTLYDDRTLVAQRERTRPPGAEQLRSTVLDRLTDRQLEVARTAYHSGYYGLPRESTGEEVAAALDVSPATFYQTNKRILGKLFDLLFDGTRPPGAPTDLDN